MFSLIRDWLFAPVLFVIGFILFVGVLLPLGFVVKRVADPMQLKKCYQKASYKTFRM